MTSEPQEVEKPTEEATVANAAEGAQKDLVESSPEHFFVPPYVGPSGWIGVRVDTGLDWKSVAAVIEQAYETTAAKATAKRRKRK